MMSHYVFSQIKGTPLQAKDGEIGSFYDLFFDDAACEIRYVVADTGKWLPGRKVLLPPKVMGAPHRERHLQVALTREQIKNSPDIDTDRPVSRRMQEEMYAYYGWSTIGMYPYSPAGMYVPPPMPDASVTATEEDLEGPQLRSIREVIGYSLAAVDGDIGEIDDAIINTDGWKITLLVVDTRKWLPGKKVLVSPPELSAVSWSSGSVSTWLTRREIENSPEYDPAAPLTFAYERKVLESTADGSDTQEGVPSPSVGLPAATLSENYRHYRRPGRNVPV